MVEKLCQLSAFAGDFLKKKTTNFVVILQKKVCPKIQNRRSMNSLIITLKLFFEKVSFDLKKIFVTFLLLFFLE